MKRVFCLIIAVAITLSLSSCSIGNSDKSGNSAIAGTSSNKSDIKNDYTEDNYLYFGTYPQERVVDDELLSSLNAQDLNWQSYGYYSGTGEEGSMAPGDIMQYANVTYKKKEYRAVHITKARPVYVYENDDGEQSKFGYYYNTTYWFEYSPIKWKILDSTSGLVVSENVLDSQPFNNTVYGDFPNYYSDSAETIYANNYSSSSLRQWLTNETNAASFYNIAFSDKEKAIISNTELDNSAYDEQYSIYNSETTTDKIFLLSYADVLNSAYGFDPSVNIDPTHNISSSRYAKGTEYAKSQGLWVNRGIGSEDSDSIGMCIWLLRTPGKNSGCCAVHNTGSLMNGTNTYDTKYGIRPALKIDFSSSLIGK